MTVIYSISSPSNKMYIGQTGDFNKRMYGHKKRPNNPFLNNSYKKYGFENHIIKILHHLPNDIQKSTLDSYEQLYINQYRDCGIKLMNIREASSHGKHSDDTKAKISNSKKGCTNEHRKGVSHSDSTRLKMKESQQKRLEGKPHFNLGSKRTEESKKKMSETQKRIGIPTKQREIMKSKSREALKNKIWVVSEETRKKISNSLTGRFRGENSPSFGLKRSQETIEKIRATKLNTYRLRKEKLIDNGID